MTGPGRDDEEVTSYVRDRMTDDLPHDFVEAVMTEVQYTPQRSGGWGGWPWVAGLATAAAAVVAVAIGLSIVQPDQVGSSPSPTPSAAPTVTPAPTGTSEATPGPTTTPATPAPTAGSSGEFGPVWSMTPEEAFSPPDSCENPDAGYRIWMPDEWYYNTAFEPFPECSLFAPVTFTATEDGSVPDGVAITADLRGPTGGLGFIDEIISRDTYTVAGLEAVRYVLEPGPGGQIQDSTVMWSILISGDPDANTAHYVVFSTDATRAPDEASYLENVDVLDRMIATFKLLEP